MKMLSTQFSLHILCKIRQTLRVWQMGAWGAWCQLNLLERVTQISITDDLSVDIELPWNELFPDVFVQFVPTDQPPTSKPATSKAVLVSIPRYITRLAVLGR